MSRGVRLDLEGIQRQFHSLFICGRERSRGASIIAKERVKEVRKSSRSIREMEGVENRSSI